MPFFGKQWGTYASSPLTRPYGQREAELRDPPRNGKGGALIGGRLYREFPGRGRLAGGLGALVIVDPLGQEHGEEAGRRERSENDSQHRGQRDRENRARQPPQRRPQ